MSGPKVTVFDNLLPPPEHAAVWAFLNQGGWTYGGFSAQGPEADRYFYKHFAGYRNDGREARDLAAIETELLATAPIVGEMWKALRKGPLQGQALSRCYANAMSGGVEGGLHLDSNIESHLTAIYYPHPAWEPDFAGETLLFNASGDEIVAAIYPKPNRLAIFSGTIPHVARPMSRRRSDLRITLMFKTMPADAGPAG
ncbi:2OG-Fe(II) oxygenase [Phenylobacterium sp.]|uniref:2OG-Fe(II) oxygenase n=1 Tax=Phenylobacterium sp. TaxID=1871053 RepID=UPI00121CC96B|nr:2OG-Fe(II) oxygenase [Phenylobacterium sp.]THD60437.1 MAG: 2OG-Fe(II) oxygenase [Phenylobacterium sp.]